MRSAWRRTGRSALGAAVLAGCLAAPAAADLRYRAADDALEYHAVLPLPHDVSIGITPTGDLRFADDLADLDPDATALAVCTPVNAREVICDPAQVRSIETALGDLADTLTNTSALLTFACGGGGNDVLRGGAGRDTLGGGPGRDEVYGGAGVDSLAVAFDDDICPGGAAVDGEVLDGGTELDLLYGGEGADVIAGGDGDDDADGQGGDDRITGGAGLDFLAGRAGDDELDGGDGNDFLAGGAGHDRIQGGAGRDRLGITARMDGNGALNGRPQVLVVESGDDVLDGGDGDDTLIAGPGDHVMDFFDPLSLLATGSTDRTLESADLNGADVLRGGPGEDDVSYLNRALPVRVTPDGVPDDGSAGEGDRVEADIEQIFGGARDDILVARREGSSLFGDNGDDRLVGDAGRDTLRGGLADAGSDVLLGGGGDDDLAGGAGDDRLEGGPASDALAGGDGEDELGGGDGDDGLQGGTGSDRLEGGLGNDCLEGFVADAVPVGCPAGIGDVAAAGADGDDVLVGGPGFDRLKGGGGQDLADWSDAAGPVLVALAGVDPGRIARQPGAAGRDQLDADVEGARGSRWADTILGNARDNLLDGGPGDDLLDGGGGSDRLRGGPGRDVLTGRDGEPDELRCGPGDDLAATDADDDLVALRADVCELVDGAAPSLPRSLATTACPVVLRLPGIRRSFLLETATVLPWRTRLTPQPCGARLRTTGARRAIGASGGAFAVVRRAGGGLALTLAGGSPAACERGSRAELRRLTVTTAQPLLVRGRAASVRGARARWTTIDRCDATAVRVLRGRARVIPDGDARAKIVRAPGHRLVRKP